MPSVSRSGTGSSACASTRGGVVLQPRQPPRRVEPDPAQEPELADRRADVRRQPAAGASTSSTSPATASSPTPRTRSRRRSRRRTSPTRRLPRARRPPSGRHRAVPPLPRGARARSTSAVADAGDADLLAGRGGGRRARTGGERGGCGRAALLGRPLDRRPPRRDAARSGSANSDEQHQRRVDRRPAGPTVTPSRRIQPSVENSDRYRWSSAKTWSRSTAGGRGTPAARGARWSRPTPAAGRRATRARCATRSRKRRWTPVDRRPAGTTCSGGRDAPGRGRRR